MAKTSDDRKRATEVEKKDNNTRMGEEERQKQVQTSCLKPAIIHELISVNQKYIYTKLTNFF